MDAEFLKLQPDGIFQNFKIEFCELFASDNKDASKCGQFLKC